MENTGSLNKIRNHLQGVALQNSNNQTNTNFYGQLNNAKSVNYKNINAINNISGVSSSTANRYINQGTNAADEIAANYGCTPGAITNQAINTFAANVNASKNSVIVNKKISAYFLPSMRRFFLK